VGARKRLALDLRHGGRSQVEYRARLAVAAAKALDGEGS